MSDDLYRVAAAERAFIVSILRDLMRGYRVIEGYSKDIPCVSVQVTIPEPCGEGLASFEVQIFCSYSQTKRRNDAAYLANRVMKYVSTLGRYESMNVYDPYYTSSGKSVLAICRLWLG